MTTDAMVPSYRVQRESASLPWRMLGIAGGLMAGVVAGAGGWWAWQHYNGPRTVPIVEADPRPFKVKPDDPGGLRVPNQGELILERPASRVQTSAQTGHPAALAPEAEAPNLERLRAALVTPPPAPVPAPAPPAAQPAAAPVVAAVAPVPAPAPVAAAPPPAAARSEAAAPPAPAPAERARPATGHVVVQLGALPTEEGARSEWARLNRLVPELLQGRTPQIVKFEREGRSPIFRLRTGGLPDNATANDFCEKVRAKRANCAVVRS